MGEFSTARTAAGDVHRILTDDDPLNDREAREIINEYFEEAEQNNISSETAIADLTDELVRSGDLPELILLEFGENGNSIGAAGDDGVYTVNGDRDELRDFIENGEGDRAAEYLAEMFRQNFNAVDGADDEGDTDGDAGANALRYHATTQRFAYGLLVNDAALFRNLDTVRAYGDGDGRISAGDVRAFIRLYMEGDQEVQRVLDASGLTVGDLTQWLGSWKSGAFKIFDSTGSCAHIEKVTAAAGDSAEAWRQVSTPEFTSPEGDIDVETASGTDGDIIEERLIFDPSQPAEVAAFEVAAEVSLILRGGDLGDNQEAVQLIDHYLASYENSDLAKQALLTELLRNGMLFELIRFEFGRGINSTERGFNGNDGRFTRENLTAFIQSEDASPSSVFLAEQFLMRYDTIEGADDGGERDGRAGISAIERYAQFHATVNRTASGVLVFADPEGRVTELVFPDGRQFRKEGRSWFEYDTDANRVSEDPLGIESVSADGNYILRVESGTERHYPDGSIGRFDRDGRLVSMDATGRVDVRDSTGAVSEGRAWTIEYGTDGSVVAIEVEGESRLEFAPGDRVAFDSDGNIVISTPALNDAGIQYTVLRRNGSLVEVGLGQNPEDLPLDIPRIVSTPSGAQIFTEADGDVFQLIEPSGNIIRREGDEWRRYNPEGSPAGRLNEFYEEIREIESTDRGVRVVWSPNDSSEIDLVEEYYFDGSIIRFESFESIVWMRETISPTGIRTEYEYELEYGDFLLGAKVFDRDGIEIASFDEGDDFRVDLSGTLIVDGRGQQTFHQLNGVTVTLEDGRVREISYPNGSTFSRSTDPPGLNMADGTFVWYDEAAHLWMSGSEDNPVSYAQEITLGPNHTLIVARHVRMSDDGDPVLAIDYYGASGEIERTVESESEFSGAIAIADREADELPDSVTMREDLLSERAEILDRLLRSDDRSNRELAYLLLSGMTTADLLALDRVFVERFGERMIEKFPRNDRLAAELFRVGDPTANYAAAMQRALGLSNNDHREQAVRNILSVMSYEQMLKLEQDFQFLTGLSLRGLLTGPSAYNFSDETVRMFESYYLGVDRVMASGANEVIYLDYDVAIERALIALDAEDVEMFGEVMRVASPDARAYFQYGGPGRRAFDDAFLDDDDDFKKAQSYLDYGELSIAIALDHNGGFLGLNTDEGGIETLLRNASPRQRELYTRGREIALNRLDASNPEDRLALRYYQSVYFYIAKDEPNDNDPWYVDLYEYAVPDGGNAESDVEFLMWEALLMYGRNNVVSRIADLDDDDVDGIMSALENMSEEDLERLMEQDANGKYPYREYLYGALDTIFDDRDLSRRDFDRAIAIIVGQIEARTEGGADESGQRPVLDIIRDNDGLGRDDRNQVNIVNAVLNMTPEEQLLYRTDSSFRRAIDSALSENVLYPGSHAALLVTLVLAQIEMGESGELGPAGRVLYEVIVSDGEPSVAIVNDIGFLFSLNPDDPVAIQEQLGFVPSQEFIHFLRCLHDPQDAAETAVQSLVIGVADTALGYYSMGQTYEGIILDVGSPLWELIAPDGSHELDVLTLAEYASDDSERLSLILYASQDELLRMKSDPAYRDAVLHTFDREARSNVRAVLDNVLESWNPDAQSYPKLTPVDAIRLIVLDLWGDPILLRALLEGTVNDGTLILGDGEVPAEDPPAIDQVAPVTSDGDESIDFSAFASQTEMATDPVLLSWLYQDEYGRDLHGDVLLYVNGDDGLVSEFDALLRTREGGRSAETFFGLMFRYMSARSGLAQYLVPDAQIGAHIAFDDYAAALAQEFGGELSEERLAEVEQNFRELVANFEQSKAFAAGQWVMAIETVAAMAMMCIPGMQGMGAAVLIKAFVAGAVMRVLLKEAMLGEGYGDDQDEVLTDLFVGGMQMLLNYVIAPTQFTRGLPVVDNVAAGVTDDLVRFAGAGVDNTVLEEVVEATVLHSLTTGAPITVRTPQVQQIATLLGKTSAEDLDRIVTILNGGIRSEVSFAFRQFMPFMAASGSGALTGGLTGGIDAAFHVPEGENAFEFIMQGIIYGAPAGAVGAVAFTGGFRVLGVMRRTTTGAFRFFLGDGASVRRANGDIAQPGPDGAIEPRSGDTILLDGQPVEDVSGQAIFDPDATDRIDLGATQPNSATQPFEVDANTWVDPDATNRLVVADDDVVILGDDDPTTRVAAQSNQDLTLVDEAPTVEVTAIPLDAPVDAPGGVADTPPNSGTSGTQPPPFEDLSLFYLGTDQSPVHLNPTEILPVPDGATRSYDESWLPTSAVTPDGTTVGFEYTIDPVFEQVRLNRINLEGQVFERVDGNWMRVAPDGTTPASSDEISRLMNIWSRNEHGQIVRIDGPTGIIEIGYFLNSNVVKSVLVPGEGLFLVTRSGEWVNAFNPEQPVPEILFRTLSEIDPNWTGSNEASDINLGRDFDDDSFETQEFEGPYVGSEEMSFNPFRGNSEAGRFYNPEGGHSSGLDNQIQITRRDDGHIIEAFLTLRSGRRATFGYDDAGILTNVNFPGRRVVRLDDGQWMIETLSREPVTGRFEFGADQTLRYVSPDGVMDLEGRWTDTPFGARVEAEGRIFELRDGTWSEVVVVNQRTGDLEIGTDGSLRLIEYETIIEDGPDGAIRLSSTESPREVHVYGLDGSVSVEHYADGVLMRVDYEYANLNLEKSRFSEFLSTVLGGADNVQYRKFANLVNSFETRARINGLSDVEIALVYHQVNRLLTSDLVIDGITLDGRLRLVQEIMDGVASPFTRDQGSRGTCVLTSLEKRLYATDPADATVLIVDMLTTGRYVSRDGVVVDLSDTPSALIPDAEALLTMNNNATTVSGRRNWVDQIFQTTIANLKWTISGRVRVDGITTELAENQYVRYEIIPGSHPREELALYTLGDDGVLVRQTLDNSPAMTVSDLHRLSYEITGESDLFVLARRNPVNSNRPRTESPGRPLKRTVAVSGNGHPGPVPIGSLDELGNALGRLYDGDQFPLIVSINTRNMQGILRHLPEWALRGGGHAIVLVDYNPVYAGDGSLDINRSTVTVSNHWGSNTNQSEISLSELYTWMGDLR